MQSKTVKDPPQQEINNLMNLYNHGQLSHVFEQAKKLSKEYPASITIWNLLGAASRALGKVNEAFIAFTKVTEINPRSPLGFNNLGIILKDLGNVEDALKAYKKAISLKGDFFEAYNNLGLLLSDQSKFKDAMKHFNKAISLKPDYVDAIYNIGVTFQAQGEFHRALKTFNKLLSIKSDHAEAYFYVGNILKEQGKIDEAITSYNKAQQLRPNYFEVFINKGTILKNAGRLVEAIQAFDDAISIKPDYAEAYFNKALTLQDQNNLITAIEAYKKAVLLKPNFAEAHNNLGNALQENGNFNQAIVAYKKAIMLRPSYAEAHDNMGSVLHRQGLSQEAVLAHRQAVALKPKFARAHTNLAIGLLNLGHIKEGLEEFEWRWKTPTGLLEKRNFSKPLWDGTQCLKNKRIMLWCEGGIGDTIKWSSRIALLASQAAHCKLECPEKLVTLLKRSFPKIEIMPENRSSDPTRDDFDYHLPLGSLYKHFLSEIIDRPEVGAFLIPDDSRVIFWKKRLKSIGNGPFVCISWKSANMSVSRLQNYAPISALSPVLALPNVNFINLQYSDYSKDLNAVKKEFGVEVHNFDDLDHFNNLDDVAALISALDAVVSTKMTVPLISAGVGTSTKLANWRQSSWSNILHNPVGPSLEIFERDTWEPWNDVFCSIANDLSKLKN